MESGENEENEENEERHEQREGWRAVLSETDVVVSGGCYRLQRLRLQTLLPRQRG